MEKEMNQPTNDDLRHDIAEMRQDFRKLAETITDMKIATARFEEKQSQTTEKLNLMTLALSNNYVSAVEFGTVKQRVDKLETWNTWLARTVFGAIVIAILGVVRIKGGI
jgi:hypothetical protein